MQLALVEQIRAAMREAFPQPIDPSLAEYYSLMEYHLGWRGVDLEPTESDSGKLIRPMVAVLACRALGGAEEEALPLAAAIQLLHDFSLVHDDIEDHSEQRRGRPTVWKLWGVELGINVGDGMFALAHRALYRLADVGVKPATVFTVVRGFEETILRICEGQHLDLTGEGRFDITESRYLAMIGGKTAALLAAAAGLGARLGTDDERAITAMTTFGEALGLAFQMHDDLLDIWGDPRLTGKPFAADLLQRKMSLPMVHAYTHAAAARATIERLYGQDHLSEDDVHRLLAILEAAGSREHVAELVSREHDRAITALEAVEPADPDALEALCSLAESLLHRAR